MYRQKMRREDINQRRAEMRSIMLCLDSTGEMDCVVCRSQWVVEGDGKEKAVQLLAHIFRERHICEGHAEQVFSKILGNLFEWPHYYSKFFTKNREENYSMFIRKVILLYEIIDNEMLLTNNELQFEIMKHFS